MTLVGSGAGASQGRLIQSSFSSVASYGIKQTTGKFPIEHVIAREKQRLAKKTSIIEETVIRVSKKQIEVSKDKITPIKNNIQSKTKKLTKGLTKAKGFAAENFKHKPRFSYVVK